MARCLEKCDVCRLRKIKCDLRRPVCQQCSIKGRPCSYGTARDLGLDSESAELLPNRGERLRLVAKRDVETGASYHTLALTKARDDAVQASTGPSRPLSSDSGRLVSRWSRMLDETMHNAHSDTTGSLFKEAARRAGSHRVLDAAITYFVDSYSAFKTGDAFQVDTARRGGINAIACLRDTLSTRWKSSEEAVMVSMSLHIVAEYFRNHFANPLIHLHSKGLCELLKTRKHQGRFGEIDMILLRAICFEEFSRAVFAGESSTLDDGLSSPSSRIHVFPAIRDVDTASSEVMLQILRLPRLISLVRLCEDQPSNFSLVQVTFELAKTLYDFQIEPLPIFVTESSTTDCGSSLDADTTCFSSWLFFHSTSDYNLVVHYYTFRLIVCALLQRILRFSNRQAYDGTDLDRVVAEEVLAAETIAKCSRYALRADSNPAWMALRMSLPIQASYGTWNRLGNGFAVHNCGIVVDPEKAACIKRFCVQFTARVQGLEDQDAVELESHLSNFSSMVAGGPLVTDMEAKVESLNWHFRQYNDGHGF